MLNVFVCDSKLDRFGAAGGKALELECVCWLYLYSEEFCGFNGQM